jgi:hypothetical protein
MRSIHHILSLVTFTGFTGIKKKSPKCHSWTQVLHVHYIDGTLNLTQASRRPTKQAEMRLRDPETSDQQGSRTREDLTLECN